MSTRNNRRVAAVTEPTARDAKRRRIETSPDVVDAMDDADGTAAEAGSDDSSTTANSAETTDAVDGASNNNASEGAAASSAEATTAASKPASDGGSDKNTNGADSDPNHTADASTGAPRVAGGGPPAGDPAGGAPATGIDEPNPNGAGAINLQNEQAADAGGDVRPVVTTDTRAYFEQDLCNRLNTINGYKHLPSATVTLRTIPYANVHWGSVGVGYADKSQYLCINNERITLRAIAEIVYPNFFKRGNANRKAGLLFKPLLEEDTHMASRILRQKSMPVKSRDDSGGEGFWSSTWMGTQGMSDKQIPVFERVYDAMDVYKNRKVDMLKYATNDLKKGDIVVVEMSITRWAIKDENEKEKTNWKKRKEWKKWNVDFRLESVALIYPGSDYAGDAMDRDDLPDDLEA
ncbi:hypothetical protein EIP86_001411 [Pleurotus ostreatoroseus]|nr:hypothetical protein EIP86_001411 [Pleurotus ostreatoroseus]